MGNSASGIDLSSQISTVAQLPVFVSEKSTVTPDLTPGLIHVPEISEFVIEKRTVIFQDGRVERNVDFVIFCTGYMYSFPFLSNLSPPIVTNGERAESLYQQIFYHHSPTLSFIGLHNGLSLFQFLRRRRASLPACFPVDLNYLHQQT